MKTPVDLCLLLTVGLGLWLAGPSWARHIPQRCRRLLSHPEYVGSLVDRLNAMVADRFGVTAAYNNLGAIQQYSPMPLTAMYGNWKDVGNNVSALRCGMRLNDVNDESSSALTPACMKHQRRTTRDNLWLKIYDDLLQENTDCGESGTNASCKWASALSCEYNPSVFPPVLCEASCEAHLVLTRRQRLTTCKDCYCEPHNPEQTRRSMTVLEFESCGEARDGQPKIEWKLAQRRLLPMMECRCVRRKRIPKKCREPLAQVSKLVASTVAELIYRDSKPAIANTALQR